MCVYVLAVCIKSMLCSRGVNLGIVKFTADSVLVTVALQTVNKDQIYNNIHVFMHMWCIRGDNMKSQG